MPFDTRNNAFEYASPFEYSNEPNLIVTNLGLFEEENHTKNSILLDKIWLSQMKQHLKNAIFRLGLELRPAL